MSKEKKIVGFTAGNFDLLHPGYIYTFEDAKKHCDHFIVFLQKDPSLHRKSKYKPVIPLYPASGFKFANTKKTEASLPFVIQSL